MVNTTLTVKQQLILLWAFWAMFQIGSFVFFFFLSKGTANPANVSNLPWMIAAAPVLLSCVIRWGVLPKIRDYNQALPTFVIGMALAESATFLGLFLFPNHREPLFALSALGIFQFVPVYARRFCVTPDPDRFRS